MPDVDRVYANLPRRYQKVYKQICEGYFSDATLAYESLRPLRKDIKSYGSPPLRFLFEAARALNDIQTSPLFINTINWGEENKQIRELKSTYSQKFRSEQRGMDLAEIALRKLFKGLKIARPLTQIFIMSWFAGISKESMIVPLATEYRSLRIIIWDEVQMNCVLG